VVTSRASITVRQPVTIRRDTGGGSSSASQPRPGRTRSPHHGVDPVARLGAHPHQTDLVPQQRPRLPNLRRGDPCLRQQMRQRRRVGPCRPSAASARSPCTAAGAPGAPRTRNPPATPPIGHDHPAGHPSCSGTEAAVQHQDRYCAGHASWLWPGSGPCAYPSWHEP
jgi:hypothetical protein